MFQKLITNNDTIITTRIRDLSDAANEFDFRLKALEAAKNNNDNSDLKRALMDADNAIQKAIAFFRRTDKENRDER